MGLIGVYAASGEQSSPLSISIQAIHLNFWILPRTLTTMLRRPLGLYEYYVDVGIRFESAEGTPVSLEAHLPGLSDSVEVIDLSHCILDDKVNDLLFGRAVSTRADTISFFRNGKEILDRILSVTGSSTSVSGQRYGLNLGVSSKTAPESEKARSFYVRFRYRCTRPDDILISKGWGFAKRGFIVDLRLNDSRETLDFEDRNKSTKMLHAAELNAFIMHPAEFVRLSQSPDTYQARILEPRAWRDYLKSCLNYKEAAKFIANQWNIKPDQKDGTARVFAHLHKEFGYSVLGIYLLGALAPTIVGIGWGLVSKIFF